MNIMDYQAIIRTIKTALFMNSFQVCRVDYVLIYRVYTEMKYFYLRGQEPKLVVDK